MKRYFTLFVFWVFCNSILIAQNSADEVFQQIESAIKKGDAAALSTHFNSMLDLTILDKEQTYSSSHAMYVMKEFFMNYPVRSFSILHKGNSGDNVYAVGSYISTKGVFDTNIFIKKYGNTYKINQLRFEPDK
jgi:hypothetical protein